MLIINGHVSYAGIEDVRSSYYSKNYAKRPHSEFGAVFMVGDDSSKKYFKSHLRGEQWDGYEEVEFIVANWTVSGVIVDDSSSDRSTIQQAVKIAKENGYPVFNTLLQRLF
jgi:sugar/nucleoside kinase (ribokinase family)